MAVDHYENFPVASWLCPPPLRPAVVAIYRFARAADDIADEGDAGPAVRLETLAQLRRELAATYDGQPLTATWQHIFGPLRHCVQQHQLPQRHFDDLLDAFEQDARNPRYRDREQLLAYCARSANPIGRLLLALYGVHDALSLRRSDQICTALQLINFWQDLSVDLQRNRVYVPLADASRHGLELDTLASRADDTASRQLVQELCSWAAELMLQGAPLAWQLRGRIGWELRLVVHGGLRILERIHRMHHATLSGRPTLTAWDAPLLLYRAFFMPSPTAERA